jgi:hypothetical protein
MFFFADMAKIASGLQRLTIGLLELGTPAVCYRTSQKTDRLYSSEFRIAKVEQPAATGRLSVRFITATNAAQIAGLPHPLRPHNPPPTSS